MTERGDWDDVNVEGSHDIKCWNDEKKYRTVSSEA